MAPPSGGSLFRFSEQTVNKEELVKLQFLVLKELRRVTNNEARLDYLIKCKVHKILPRFLTKFKFPKIAAYRPEKVMKFQFKTLEEEISRLQSKSAMDEKMFVTTRDRFRELCSKIGNDADVFGECMESIKSKIEVEKCRLVDKLDKKLTHLALIQNKSIGVTNEAAVRKVGLEIDIPVNVHNTLSRGPKCPVKSKFDKIEFLAEMDLLVEHVENIEAPTTNDDINLINIKACQYNRKFETDNYEDLEMIEAKKWLKNNNCKAIPMDKGNGFAIMSSEDYQAKLSNVVDGSRQFILKKLRKNGRAIELVEQSRINKKLVELMKHGKISSPLCDRLKSIGSQVPKMYGLAKTHKRDVPLRPIVAMVGSPYDKVGNEMSKWLGKLDASKINCRSKLIVDTLTKNGYRIPTGYQIVSLDIESLYTNVPITEAIELATDLIYEQDDTPPFDKETCRELLELCCSNTIVNVNGKIYTQTDGLSMGSKIAPMLANIWLANLDEVIKDNAELYYRYMDDICTLVQIGQEENLLNRVNSIHPNLKFTLEKLHADEQDGDKFGYISFLDIKITVWNDRSITTEWYRKETSTDVVMNWFSTAPMKYKVNIVYGLVNRIWDTSSTYQNFTSGLDEARKILIKNQYPEEWVDSKIGMVVEKIFKVKSNPNKSKNENEMKEAKNATEEIVRRKVFLKYKGLATEKLAKELSKIHIPIQIIYTLDKLRAYVSQLKCKTEKCNQSNLIYQFKCGFCNEEPTYIGYTERLLRERITEHGKNGNTEVSEHLRECGGDINQESFTILYKINKNKGLMHLRTAEALFIRSNKPSLNNKDEFRSRKLRLKLF